MSLNILDFEKIEVLPSNQPAGGRYSFRNGTPIITLEIPANARYLRTSSLRINGALKITGGPNAILPNNNRLKKGIGPLNDIVMNSRVGVNACFQNVNLISAATNQSLESIRQYGRLVTSILSSTHSQQDMATEKSCTAVMNGLDSASSNMVNNEVRFSIPLYAGLLRGQSFIPLSANGVNGLRINLELASDQQLLTGSGLNSPGNAADGAGAFFELSDISLTCDLAVPDAEGVQELTSAGSGAFEYLSWSSLYSVINSGDATQTYNLANTKVLSVAHTFLPVSFSNSYSHDGFGTDMLKNSNGGAFNGDVELRRVSFSRGGVRLGLDYEMRTSDQSLAKIPETQVLMNYLQAYQPIGRMLNGRQIMGYGGQMLRLDRPANKLANRDHGVSADDRRNFGIGLELDPVSDEGVNFRGQSYATRIVSSLDGQSANAVFTFILAKNTLTYTPQCIIVTN